MNASASRPRTVFMGSPEFALPCLEALVSALPVVGVVTQPDRPAGRGNKLNPPPVKLLAQSLGLPLIQPRSLRTDDALERLKAWAPELIVVAAFGQILRPQVLELPRWGCINVHASLLPRWRGAAPVQAALLHGDTQSGVTIMQMDAGIDSGAILSQRVMPILPMDTSATLGGRLAEMGAELLVETLGSYLADKLRPQPQPEDGVTYAKQLVKEDGRLDLSRPAEELARQVRAYNPWPGTFFDWQGGPLKVHQAHAVEARPASVGLPAGSTVRYLGLPALATKEGWLVLDEVQPAGRKPQPGKEFLNGARGWG